MSMAAILRDTNPSHEVSIEWNCVVEFVPSRAL